MLSGTIVFGQNTSGSSFMELKPLPNYTTKVNLQNAILPGFGTSLITQNNSNKIIAIGFYGCIGSGGYFLSRANTNLDNYLNAESYSDAQTAYENTIRNRKLGYTFLGVGVGIWLFEMVRGNIVLSKKRNEIKKHQKEFLSFSIYPTSTINRRTSQPQLGLSIKGSF